MREIIRTEGIVKRYENYYALNGVDFAAHEKEIVGLVGDNGAGKTTLMNIMVGLFPPDKGKIFLEGKEVSFTSPADARSHGVEIVYQFGNLVEGLSIYKNFFLGREVRRRIGPVQVLDRRKMREVARDILLEIGIDQNPEKKIEALSGGQMQAVAIGRAFHFGKKVLLLDEPTRNLSIKEVDRSLRRIELIRERTDMCLVFVTHNISHVFNIADRIVLLDRGEKVFDKKTTDTTIGEVSDLIAKETVQAHSRG
ncbi:MAG TPA: ATP-binding cassette domain-containing protein [Spirochaetia bacterium]|nr:ATP-binding cassette domain-containing protein [Spirochaetia bacterium]